jgi:hypothetical protein
MTRWRLWPLHDQPCSRRHVQDFAEAVAEEYRAATQITPEIYLVSATTARAKKLVAYALR